MGQSLGIERFFVLMLQLMGPRCGELLDLLIPAMECRGKRCLTGDKVLFLGVQLGLRWDRVASALGVSSLAPSWVFSMSAYFRRSSSSCSASWPWAAFSSSWAWWNQACASVTYFSMSASAWPATAFLDFAIYRRA